MSKVRFRAALAAVAFAATGLVSVTLAGGGTASAAVTLNDSEVTANLWEWNWPSVAAACTNHLGPAGYGAVQVAPPQESVSLPTSADGAHPWYEVYQPVSYRLDSRFGDRAQFASMVTTCHNAGVRVYVDAVVNHMAGTNNAGGTTGYAGTAFTGYSYPAVPYSSADFHHPGDPCPTSGGISDWNNEAQVTGCELLSLSDLYTEKDYVRGKIAGYLNDLIGIGVDGFRVDAVKHIRKDDFANILGRLNNTTAENKRPYVAQEIFDGASNNALKAAAFTGNGDVLDFAYAKGIRSAFQGSISALANVSSWALDAPSANVFAMVTNHDLERDGVVLSYKNGTDYTLANYFALAYPHGKPSVYDSFTWTNRNSSPPADGNGFVTAASCGASWNCLTQSTAIKGMVGWANTAKAVKSVSDFTTVNANVIGFHRGDRAWIGINDSGSASTSQFSTGLANGAYCDVITGTPTTTGCTGTTVTVASGTATVTIPANSAVAIHAGAKPGTDPTPTPTPTPTETGTTVAETFTVTATVNAGQSVYLVGSIPALASWNPVNAIPLTAGANNTWSATVNLPKNTAVEFKYVKKDASGNVTWETNANRTVTTTTAAQSFTSTFGTAGVTVGTDPTPSPTPTPSETATTTEVTFNATVTTTYGTNVYLVGSPASLGSWNPANAIPLSSAAYPVWSKAITFPKSTPFEYKLIKKDASGNVTWESGANRTYTTGTTATSTVTLTWK
ncbi:carbohydrate-binding module family 20 domain-containing protein [Actinocorallia longicatena]|uniref:Alpha-amylase n=1 Tax=Actinocorallia longicatena TaxID=111803 RepID=A0ABP6QCD1_9ACTN